MASFPPLRNVDGQEFEQPIDKNTEGLVAKGFYPQNSSSNDEAAGIERDANGYLILIGKGPANQKLVDWLLSNEPHHTNITYIITRSSGVVTKEEWKTTSGSVLLKSIDYTRSSGLLATEVVKVFAPDGTTVVAQQTTTYSRSGGNVTGATTVRDV